MRSEAGIHGFFFFSFFELLTFALDVLLVLLVLDPVERFVPYCEAGQILRMEREEPDAGQGRRAGV